MAAFRDKRFSIDAHAGALGRLAARTRRRARKEVCLSRQIESPVTFHALYDSALVGVRNYSCRAGRGGPAAEEHTDGHHIVLVRAGVFCKHFGRRSVTADVNQAVFFSAGSTYRVSHPAECGDRGTVLVPSPRLLHDLIRELDPTIDDRPNRPFPFFTAPCAPGTYARHLGLVRRLETADADSVDPLWADTTVLQLVAEVLRGAFARHLPVPGRRRSGTDIAHAACAEAVKSYLASRLGERIRLDEVARAVHASPFHLSRVFRQRTGLPIHRYLTRLRLRASLDRLADGPRDLTGLALDLGFSSHSHFADAFRREFGRTPSEVRRDATPRALRELSKNLKA